MRYSSLFIAGALLLGSVCTAHAQESLAGMQRHHAKPKIAAKTTVASMAEDLYDVKYVKLDLAATNASTELSGCVTTHAVVTGPGMPSYVFELNPEITIDSVVVNGATVPVTGAGVVRTAALPAPLASGATFIAQVFYHGTPTSGTPADVTGINSMISPSWGTRATFTLSESYDANDWWPCKQSLKDKIDSADIWLTVADSLKAGSNGVLTAVTAVDATHNRYEWKTRYPIDYYLISLAVAPYVDYSYYMHFTGSTDSMLVQNYVYNNPATLPFFKTIIDSTGPMIDYFSQLFGRYPFWQEKYGHCMARLSGGMEHQTMTTLGFFEGGLVAHELGHQWFGDNVTCATWKDIFVNEGFASYSEYLFKDKFRSHALALADIGARQNSVKSTPGGTVYVDDTTDEDRIFSSRLSYDKGACVLHMLRSVINNDSVYFLAIKTYQEQMRDSTATTIDFLNVVKSVTGAVVNGIDLDVFWNQWIFLQGYPIYTLVWNQVGSDIYLRIDQATAVPGSVSYFMLPIEIKMRSVAPSTDTLVRVLNNAPSQLYHFTWSKQVSTFFTDPDFWLIHSVSSIVRDNTLGVAAATLQSVRVSPNPTRTGWSIAQLPAGSTLNLVDISGRILWTGAADNGVATVPAEALATGLYLLNVSSGNERTTLKLIKE